MARDLNALYAYLAETNDKPFAWGSNDCVTFAAGAVKAQTGRDLLVGLDSWTSEAEAESALDAVFGLEAAVDAHLTPLAAPGFAHRGDIGLVQLGNRQFLTVVLGDLLVGPGETGLFRLSRRAMIKAWSAE